MRSETPVRLTARAKSASSSSRSRETNHRGLWLAARALRNHEHGGGGGASETRFFDPGKGVVQALVKAGGEHLLSRQDLDPLDAVDPREEIAVRGPQAAGVGGLIADGDDEMPVRAAALLLDQPRAQPVLVDAAGGGYPVVRGREMWPRGSGSAEACARRRDRCRLRAPGFRSCRRSNSSTVRPRRRSSS